MGRAKEEMMDYYSRKYSKIADKNVCGNHFEDEAILDFIDNNADEEGICSYCRLGEQEGGVLPLDVLIRFIENGIHFFYRDPNDEGVSYESAEGGWQGVPVFDAQELLQDEVSLEIDNTRLFVDIMSCFNESEWCRRDPYFPTESQKLSYNWRYFSDLLKHKIRFVFFRTTEFDKNSVFEEQDKAYEILDEVGSRINIDKVNLLKIIKPGSIFYRARQHSKKDKIQSIFNIGSPPNHAVTASNRMSPIGISMFYGAFDSATAIKEVINKRNTDNPCITVAEINNINQLQVIDFTKLPEVPSIFDEKKRKNYYSILFLSEFVSDLAKEIDRDGKEHVEYVPTQVVTEYFRYVFPEFTGSKIDGIIYPSSKVKGGKCCVLFFDNTECGKNFTLNSPLVKTSLL